MSFKTKTLRLRTETKNGLSKSLREKIDNDFHATLSPITRQENPAKIINMATFNFSILHLRRTSVPIKPKKLF